MTHSTPNRPLDPEKLLQLARGASASPSPGGFVPPTVEELSRLLPDFEIQEFIGRGGMGAVYRARQPRLDRTVAIKILPRDLASDPAFAERFEREARTLARLNHPNIVKLFDFGVREGLHYLVLEYVDGVNLRDLMAMGRPSPAEALRIIPRICEALESAHRQGVVHRDIKPENILVDHAGEVHLTDFGIARLLGAGTPGFTLTASGQRLGTPHYMAPEQVETPDRVDHRADLFAVGVVFYELLTGRLPLGRFDPPSAAADVGPKVDDIVFRSLDREPDRRYQAAKALRDDVVAAWNEGFVAGARTTAERTGPSEVLPSGSARVPAAVAIAARRDTASSATRSGAAAGIPPTSAPPPELGEADLVAPALCWRGVWGCLWFLASLAGFFLWLVPVAPQRADEIESAPSPSLKILGIAVLLFSAGGVVGGPILGIYAERAIHRARGALYGLRPAILATWLPALLVFDAVAFAAGEKVQWEVNGLLGVLIPIVALVLNYVFLARQVARSRAVMRRTR